jgi:hypothetical protein
MTKEEKRQQTLLQREQYINDCLQSAYNYEADILSGKIIASE